MGQGRDVVLDRNAQAALVEHPQRTLAPGLLQRGSAGVEPQRLGIVLRNPVAYLVHVTQAVERARVVLVGRQLVPFGRFDEIDVVADAPVEHPCVVELPLRKAGLGQGLEQRLGRGSIFGHDAAPQQHLAI